MSAVETAVSHEKHGIRNLLPQCYYFSQHCISAGVLSKWPKTAIVIGHIF